MTQPDIRTLAGTRVSAVQLQTLKERLAQTSTDQLTELLPTLEPKEQVIAFRLLPKDRAIVVFERLEPRDQAALVRGMEDPEVLPLLEALEPDERMRLFDELPAKVAKRLIAGLSPDARRVVNELLGYPEESAGREMSPYYHAVRMDTTVGAALASLRSSPLSGEQLGVVFVIDEGRFYQGFIQAGRLLKADPQAPVRHLVEAPEVYVRAHDDRLRAATLLKRHRLPALAVTDAEGRLVGAITFDDVVDLLEEEASETMYWKAGVGDLTRRKDEVNSQRLTQGSVWYPVRVRILFLLVTLAGGLAVGGLIDRFEEILEAVIAAAVFIPLVMDMGGNVGTQSTTIFARGLALGHIDLRRFGRHLGREVAIGAIMGLVLGLVAGAAAYFWQGAPNGVPQLGVAVGVSIATVVTFATLLGFLLPWLMVKLGLDHAPGADPFITTIKDFVGLALYFYLVSALIGVGEGGVEAALGALALL
ncbi:magnesium transporter [Truepera radiovictrix]|uniref:Magnesium transporter MgtE n=1 Tax=Truepera radiovictrix (strain DSM 17093 / CIP 108686 / LMG 22925 / RQ-24) TaxID=649638 RepID=D7CU88_TRURR|nr:magnesium transporter [Truepera radiovictrix]ADI13986.1 magnesium transporter [Truepera radiovictrix DSM 17093]WMT57453.1 magnesium transporter [Truepera radiovictrix]